MTVKDQLKYLIKKKIKKIKLIIICIDKMQKYLL